MALSKNAELIQGYVEYLLAVRGLAESTAMQYNEVLRIADRKQLNLEQATEQDLINFVQYYAQREEGVHARRLATVITTLKGFFKYALEHQLIASNPAKNLQTPKLPKTLPKFISQVESKSLLKACEGDLPEDFRARALIYLLYDTGVRVSECANLTMSDWTRAKEEGGIIVFGKGSKQRFVPLSSTTKGIVDAYVDYARDEYNVYASSYLFPSRKSKKPLTRNRLWQIVKALGEKAGIELSPHAMRHTFATHMVEEGADLRSVQQMLGHADLATTQIYATLVDDKLTEAVTKNHPLMSGFKNADGDD